MKLRIALLLVLVPLVFVLGCSSKCKDGENAECWMKALEDPERIEKAIDNLKQIGDKKAEPALLKAFEDSAANPKYRERIAEIFKKWKTKSAVGPMIAAIDFTVGPNKDGRKAKRTNRANQKIASALGTIGDPQAINHLMRLMKLTKEPTVQRAAIRALGKLKAKGAVDELLALSEDPGVHKIVRLNAVYALGEIGDPRAVDSLVLALYRDKAYYFAQAGLALVKIGEPAVDPLVKAMNGQNKEAKKLNEENVEVLAGALEANAAKILGDIGSEKAVEPILKLAEKVDKWPEETNRLLVMSRLINSLGSIGDNRALPMIYKYLEKELWDVRTICATAINNISDRSAVAEMLKHATTGEHPRTRAPLIEAIGNLGTDEVLPQLQEMEKTQKDVTVSKVVQDSLKRIQAYAQCKDNASCWIGKLSDKEDVVREKAAYELGRIGDQAAVDPLLKIINDQSENVRFAVIWAFDKLKSKKPIEPIDELIEEEKGSRRFQVVNHNYSLLIGRLSRTGK